MKKLNNKERIERFNSYIIPEPNTGCHLWTGGIVGRGYGTFNIGNKKSIQAHRFAYQLNIGKLIDGMVIMHSCDTPCCVNPKHLKQGTQKDNVIDAVKKNRMKNPHKNKTHCKYGHEFTKENTRWLTDKHRRCLTCTKINNAKNGPIFRARYKANKNV